MPLSLTSLTSIIHNAAQCIESRYTSQGLTFPSLDAPLNPHTHGEAEALLNDKIVVENATILLTAATQLIATVKLPQTSVFNAGCSYYLSASLRVAVETHVVEILRDAGEEGLHVKEIGRQNGISPLMLSRILRYLAVHHIFRETAPDTFANNRLSSVLDTGKTVAEILKDPLQKHDGTNGIAALVGHCADEDYKGAGHILEHLTSSATRQNSANENSASRSLVGSAQSQPTGSHLSDPTQSPMLHAFSYAGRGDVWSWFEQPSNIMRFKRFGAAMKGVSSVQAEDAILKGFDWTSLPTGSTVIDVGGGIGVSSMAIAKTCPELKVVIQDRAKVVEEAKEHWTKVYPEAITRGQVIFQEHDFFTAQPISTTENGTTVFLLKQILHDWADEYAKKILMRLKNAAEEILASKSNVNGSRDEISKQVILVIVDSIVPYACRPGATPPNQGDLENIPIPETFWPIPGSADPSVYYTDLSMYVHFNGQERTLGHTTALLRSCGWELEQVVAPEGLGRESYLPQLIARPVAGNAWRDGME